MLRGIAAPPPDCGIRARRQKPRRASPLGARRHDSIPDPWLSLVLMASTSAASAAPPNVHPRLQPGRLTILLSVTSQQVTFISTSTPTGNNSIQQELWDLNGDGRFGDQAGHSVVTTFSTAGDHVVRLQVVDERGAERDHLHSETVVVRPFNDQSPVASFVHVPGRWPPTARVHQLSTRQPLASDSAIAVQRWDLNSNGSYSDVDWAGDESALSRSRAVTRSGLQVEDTTIDRCGHRDARRVDDERDRIPRVASAPVPIPGSFPFRARSWRTGSVSGG